MSFDLERDHVGPGWQPIIEQLHAELLKLDPDYDLLQIKEKFGGLRYYIQMSNKKSIYDAQEALIAEAERNSMRTCESCGEKGKNRLIGGWYQTLCDDCAEKAKEARAEAMRKREADKQK